MRKPLIAPDCKNHKSVFDLLIQLRPDKKGVSRIFTLFLIVVMLTQVLFVGPVRKANAKARPLVVDTSSPMEPFNVNTPPTFAGTVISGVSSLLGFVSPTTAKRVSPKTEESAVEPPSPPASPMMATGSAYDLAQLRLSPKNATGGTDLYSRNFGWGTSLVGLPGRAGLDVGFGISYNSLVWIKDTTNSEIIFDPDISNVSPGFNFGFSRIEAPYQDPITEAWRFLVVSPDGGRTEFKQDGSSANFYPGDSSYRKLYINDTDALEKSQEEIDITIVSTDGTKMHYLWNNGAYRCYEIKDRNGNFISIDYNGYGRMTEITDTLGREITINYDGGGYPTTITQGWKATNGEGASTTHTWATFSYTNATVSTSFSGLTVIGPANSTTVKVLEKITYPDSSFTKFEYNGYIQVKKISQVAADSTSHILNYVTTDLASVSGTQSDCPRFGETKTWVENFNLSGGTPQEVVVTNSLTTGATYSLPNSITGSATRIDVAMTGHPDGLYSRTYVGASGYKEGLTLATEDCTGSNCATRLRWTWTDWTQDNTGVSYITNPRVVESRVGDGTNVKKTTIGYGSNGYGLPEEVKVYDSDLSTVLKTQTTTYSSDSAYITRRIIGLPTETKLWQGTTSGTLMSKVTYTYDDETLTGTDPVQNISPTQHDNTNYSSSFVTGRGNLTHVKRWDATAPTTSGSAVTTSMLHNTAGAVVSKTDPLSHTVKIAYADNFNTTGNPTTYAYPTTITDQAGNSSTVKYRYDIGANIVATSPAPAGQTYGKTSIRLFDSIGRLDRQSIYVNTTEKAYTRYEYPTNGIQSKSYTPIIDADGDTNIAEDEVYTESWFDGAGRVRGSRTEHPGSTGGWTATQTEYDVLGRVYRRSVPTEVSAGSSPYSPSDWTPAGDDSTRGWIWNKTYYDWKGRTTRTVPSDSTGSDGKDTLISYAGCGCAGGQVTTVSGPVATAVDVSGTSQTTKRRTFKSYEDILGRTYKTEVWDLDGAGTYPYSTTKTTFNGRDQATLVRQYEGPDSSGTYQDTTMAYDGHGRLTTQRKPEQAVGRNTTYTYLADDRVATVTDARGAGTHYDYDVRGLVEEISYSLPGNDEGETPWVHHTDKSGTADLSIKGGGFASNVEVKIIGWNSTDGFTDMQTFTGGSLSRGTSGGYETLGFTVTDSTAIYNLNNSVFMYTQVTNTDTGQKTRYDTLYYNGSSVSYGFGKSDTPAAAPTISFEYDDLGNKTEMTDGVGTVEYEYDSLSQITSETREFTDITSRTFETQYTYELSGLLKTITDPFSAVVSYSYQKNGRLSAVGSTGFNWTNPFISDLSYRAWGSIKQADYGNGSELNMAYDSALRPTQFEVTQSSYTRGTDYTYYADGKLHTAEDLADDHFDKAYKFDHAGRMKEALSGFEARGETNPDASPIVNRPYKQTYNYDVWDNRTGGEHWFWRTDMSGQVAATYVNNRAEPNTSMAGSTYDADGRPAGNKVDASSKPIESITGTVGGYTTYPTTYPVEPALEITQTFDGGRGIGKRQEISRKDEPQGEDLIVVEETTLTYYVRSEVLGGKTIAEVKPDATKRQGNVYANGALLAEWNNGASMVIEMNPLTGSFYKVDSNANAYRHERDPKGAVMGTEDPWLSVLNPVFKDMLPNEQPFIDGGDPFNPSGGCEKDGMSYSCSQLDRELDHGSAVGVISVGGVDVAQFSGYRLRQMMGTIGIKIGIHNWTEYDHSDSRVLEGGVEGGDWANDQPSNDSHSWQFINLNWSFSFSGSSRLQGGWNDLSKRLDADFFTLQNGLYNFLIPPRATKQNDSEQSEDDGKAACELMVLNPLASIGFDLKDFLGYLGKGKEFFDGTTSTQDTNAIFGNNTTPPNGWQSGPVGSVIFTPNPGLNAFTSYNLSGTKLTVGFNRNATSSVGLLFHEGLHGYGVYLNGKSAGAFSDDGLKKLFHVTGSGTSGVTKHINDYCGEYLSR